MRTRAAVVALAVAIAVGGGPALPAAATHPCARSSDGTAYDAFWTADHDACGGGLPPAQPGDVTVTNADDGGTVTVPRGSHLRVALDATPGQPVWSEVAATSQLHRGYLDVQRPRSSAVFDADQATDGAVVTASGPATWSVTVVVPSGQGTASPEPCQTQRVPAAYDGATVLTEADDGRTVQVDQGDAVGVFFVGCGSGFDLQPATATGPLQRYRVRAHNPGGASAVFSANATGTATLTATSDAGCLHSAPACAAAQRQWQVTVQVVESCRLAGPAVVPAGSDAQLTGRFRPGSTVQVWFRPYGGATFTARRTLTADASGGVFTSYRALTDQRWYATSGGCTSPPGLTRVTPSVDGPATASRGAVVPIVVRGPAGAAVTVWFAGVSGGFAPRRTGRLDAAGVFRTSYLADVEHRYYAVTGPDRRTTTTVLTRVR